MISASLKSGEIDGLASNVFPTPEGGLELKGPGLSPVTDIIKDRGGGIIRLIGSRRVVGTHDSQCCGPLVTTNMPLTVNFFVP